MTNLTRIGMLTPSSNTVLEPVTYAMLAGLDDVSAHFSRFRVTEISLADQALGQFDIEPMLAAARLLADARVDVICWNGTSAGWLGLDQDRRLCNAITEATGIPTTSAVLALVDIFRLLNITDYGLVTPYVNDVQERIRANFASEGFRCAAERHLDQTDNFSFAEVAEPTITTMVRETARAKPQAITVFCTNLRGGPLVQSLEDELGIPILDTVATAIWGALHAVGANTQRISGWGQLFQRVA